MNKLIPYAISFVSFALDRLKSNVDEVILFGSVARGDFGKDSDVDLFFTVRGENNELDKEIKSILSKFYKSKIYQLWEDKSINNSINVKAGILDDWKLKSSIFSEGIQLYGKYKSEIKGEAYAIVSFKPIKDITKRNKVVRELFGRKEKNQEKQGLINVYNGKRLSPSVFVIPIINLGSTINILKNEKVDYSITEFWSESV